DEPFGALDAITRAELLEAYAALRARLGVTTLFVTHDLREARKLADRVLVMRAGRIEQDAPMPELVAHPATPYVAELIRRALDESAARPS
ncbi:MAG: ABC transporter ATP-binding protein, partial [Gemmatimonadaceae bacterium]